MIKTMTKFIAGFAAAASLLLATGCTNQLDYVNDNTALNKFNVAGLKVTGLDESYNGADIKLLVKEGTKKDGEKEVDNYVAYVSGKVASSYTNEKGDVVGYQSGSAYIKLETPELFDGDSLHTSKFECYLSVGTDTIKVLSSDGTKLENAKLAVPTSPAGTRNADLKSKFVEVVVNDGIGTFSFADKPAEPVNVTLVCITAPDFSDKTVAAVNGIAGYELSASEKKGEYGKYKITVTGLDNSQNGQKVQLAGATIGGISDNLKMGDYWDGGEADVISAADQEKSSFNQEIKDNKVSWEFYGSEPSWNTGKGVAIKIYKPGCKDKVFFLKTGASGNFLFPKEVIGKDVELTIDVSKLTKGSDWSVDDPVAKTSKLYIDGIKIVNAPSIGKAGYIALCEAWLPKNEWGASTTNKIKSLNADGNAEFIFEESLAYTPNTTYFDLSIQILNPGSDADFWADKSKIGGGTITTSKYSTAGCVDTHFTLVVKVSGSKATASLVDSELVLDNFNFDIKGIKIVNAPSIGKAGYIALCEAWLPSNAWGASTPNKIKSIGQDHVAVLEFDSPYSANALPFSKMGIQILNPDSDADFWADNSKIGGGVINVTIPGNINGKTVYMIVDAADTSKSRFEEIK